MAAIVAALTAFSPSVHEDERARSEEVNQQLQMLLDSTSGAGMMHESVNAWKESDYSRAWFGWANGLMGELVLKLAAEDDAAGNSGAGWLAKSFQ
jgi:meiotically up-regulated gene 157 (Mug157) protein